MHKKYLTIILAVVLFSGAVWAADCVRGFISGRYNAYPVQNQGNGLDHKIWILDSESGNVKFCTRKHFGGPIECTDFSD